MPRPAATRPRPTARRRGAAVVEMAVVTPILLIEFLFVPGLALLFSTVQVRLRDIGIAMPLLLQLWIFGSPVIYSFAQVPRRFRALYLLNPMVGIVENFRRGASIWLVLGAR